MSAPQARMTPTARGVPLAGAPSADDRDAAVAAPQLLRDDLAALDRVDRGVDDRIGERPAGEPAVLAAGDEHDDRRAVGDLELELAREPHAAGRLRLAVEHHQVNAALVEFGDDLRLRRALDPLDAPDVGRRAAAHGGADGGADVGGIAVDEHRRLLRNPGHAAPL